MNLAALIKIQETLDNVLDRPAVRCCVDKTCAEHMDGNCAMRYIVIGEDGRCLYRTTRKVVI